MENMPFKIVIIDDNEDYIFTMKTFLEREGFEVETARDGKAGMDLIKQTCPDLIMLDVMMETTFSGFEVCREVRNDPTLKETPVFGISGMAEELGVRFDKNKDTEYFSPDAYFDKPVDKNELLAKINDLK